MLVVLAAAGKMVPWQAYAGIVYLYGVFMLMHYYVNKPMSNANAQIRTSMIASVLRMFLAILFFIILLYNAKQGDAKFNLGKHQVFVISYILYFLFALVLDILIFRSKLRALLEEKNKNANS